MRGKEIKEKIYDFCPDFCPNQDLYIHKEEHYAVGGKIVNSFTTLQCHNEKLCEALLKMWAKRLKAGGTDAHN